MFPPRFLQKTSAFQHLVVTLNPSNRVLGVGMLEPICVAMLPAKDVPRHHRDLTAEEVRCSAVGEVGEKCDPAEVGGELRNGKFRVEILRICFKS